MRIRKNTRFSSRGGLGVEVHQHPHLCQLNQSPWDAIPLSPEISYQSSNHQLERENGFDGKGRIDHSVHAVDREGVAAYNVIELNPSEKEEGKALDDNEQMRIESELKSNKKDDEFNFDLKNCRSRSDKNPWMKKQERVGRSRGRKGKRGRSLSSNRHEFYYYSGFGPLWGNKRDRKERSKVSNAQDTEINSPPIRLYS